MKIGNTGKLEDIRVGTHFEILDTRSNQLMNLAFN